MENDNRVETWAPAELGQDSGTAFAIRRPKLCLKLCEACFDAVKSS